MNFQKSILVAFLAIPISASAGSVRSMSAEHKMSGPGGEIYIASEVDCSGTKDDRVIWRKESDSEWCAKDVEGFCSRRKISAAKEVCDRAYERALEGVAGEPEMTAAPAGAELTNPVPESSPLTTSKDAGSDAEVAGQKEAIAQQKEQLAIERERLKLEQERLELRRQQVELQKQELEIKRQMEAEKQAEQSKQAAQAAQKKVVPKVDRAPEPAPSTDAESAPKKSVLGM